MENEIEICYTWCYNSRVPHKIDVSRKTFEGDELINCEVIECVEKPENVDYHFMSKLFI